MEIACVIDKYLATPPRPDHAGGPRSGRVDLADPVAAAEATEAMVQALEAIGAAVESERAGEAFFALDGLRGLHGGSASGVLAAARRGAGRGKGDRRRADPVPRLSRRRGLAAADPGSRSADPARVPRSGRPTS